MSSAVAFAFIVAVLVVGGLIGYAIYKWGRQHAISNKTRAELTTSEEYRRLSEVALLGAHERHQVALEWNDAASEYPSSVCLHERIWAQAARRVA